VVNLGNMFMRWYGNFLAPETFTDRDAGLMINISRICIV
jgi:hypothetical protein